MLQQHLEDADFAAEERRELRIHGKGIGRCQRRARSIAPDPDVMHGDCGKRQNPDIDIADHPPSINRVTWEHIQKVLQEHDGNISATARALGMHRRTLQRKLQKRPVKR